jgi:hypothetical protein
MHRLAFVLPLLLAVGLATQVQAARIQCPWCDGFDTYSHFIHEYCPNGTPPWPEWNEPAMAPGDTITPPPLPGTCPLCGQSVGAEFCWCANETISKPFWP